MHPSVDEAETISRTLLLAQRTADTTVAEAQAEADRVLAAARNDAAASLDEARQETARLIEEARAEARRAGESERVQVEGEVQALLARRDFLESDVDHLEQYLVAQRERITEAVAELNDLVQRIPGGLADMRRPLMSAAAEPSAGADAEAPGVDEGTDGGDEQAEIAEITKVAESGNGQPEPSDATPASATPLFEEDGEPDPGDRRREPPGLRPELTATLGVNGDDEAITSEPSEERVAATSVEPNGSGPSPPAQTSGGPPWRVASRVVPRSGSAAGSSLHRATSAGAEP